MDRSRLLKKVATILGVSDTEKELAFEVLLDKISDLLEADEAVKVHGLGYFQVKKKPTKLVERIIESDLGTESKDTILFSPVTDDLLAEKKMTFLTFEINSKQSMGSKIDENVFDIGFGKPILPLAKEIGSTDSDTSYLLLKKSIEERVLELLSNSDKLENFDLWEEYLQQVETEDNISDEPTLSSLNMEESKAETTDDDDLIARAISQETVFDVVDEDDIDEKDEDEELLELMKNENLSLSDSEVLDSVAVETSTNDNELEQNNSDAKNEFNPSDDIFDDEKEALDDETNLVDLDLDDAQSSSISFAEDEFKNEFGAFSDQKAIHDRMAEASKTVLGNDFENGNNELSINSKKEEDDLFSIDFFDKKEDLIGSVNQDNFDGLLDNSEANKTITKSEEDMGDDNNKDSLDWDFEEIHDDDDAHKIPEQGTESEDDDVDLFKKLEESLADGSTDSDTHDTEDSLLGTFEVEANKSDAAAPVETTGITLDRSEMDDPIEDVEKPRESVKSGKSYSDMRKKGSGMGKVIIGIVSAIVIVVFVIVYFFNGSGTTPSNSLSDESVTSSAEDAVAQNDLVGQDGQEVISIDKNDTPNEVVESGKTEPEQKQQPVVKQPTSGEDVVRVYENEKSVGNLIFFNGKDYYFQVSSHESLEKAKAAANTLKRKGFDAFVMKAWINKYNAFWYRVKVGYFKSLEEARNFQRNNKF